MEAAGFSFDLSNDCGEECGIPDADPSDLIFKLCGDFERYAGKFCRELLTDANFAITDITYEHMHTDGTQKYGPRYISLGEVDSMDESKLNTARAIAKQARIRTESQNGHDNVLVIDYTRLLSL